MAIQSTLKTTIPLFTHSLTFRALRASQILHLLDHLHAAGTNFTTYATILSELDIAPISISIIAQRAPPSNEAWLPAWEKPAAFEGWCKIHMKKWVADLSPREEETMYSQGLEKSWWRVVEKMRKVRHLKQHMMGRSVQATVRKTVTTKDIRRAFAPKMSGYAMAPAQGQAAEVVASNERGVERRSYPVAVVRRREDKGRPRSAPGGFTTV